ncbi:MAG: relaxase/mobilization nuclease domain-containing protein [Candidatus Parvarchaeota archaeon]|nr:relaxase/mobilization nuclease domain-containing protein [Candidatus Parvarchaeum tengchongense]MDZ7355953.1 relaxase/mobilization nuclease domain-containing protein [candidate division KSB1 bacterium]
MAVIKRIASKATPSKIVNYLTQEEKTEEKLIGGKDCDPDNVVNDFNITQELYGKTGGIKYHHIIQSFSPEDNITPKKAHELGKELAESQFKGFEVFVVTHKDKEHIHNHLVVNSVSFENGLKYNASNKSLWDIKRESNKLCERENLKVLDLEHKAEKRISSAEKRIMDRGQVPWKDELRQCIDVAIERTKDLQGFREFLEKNFDIETRVTKNSISYKHPDHGKAIRGRSLGERYNKEELENGFNGQEKSISRNGERGLKTEGSTSIKYRGITGLDNEFERRANSIEQQINKDFGLDRARKTDVQEQGRERRKEAQGISGENKSSIQNDDKQIRGIKDTSSREVRKDFEGSSRSSKNSYGNDESIEQHSISSGENRQAGLERQSKTVHNSNGNNARSNSTDSRSIQPSKNSNKIKSRGWDMDR